MYYSAKQLKQKRSEKSCKSEFGDDDTKKMRTEKKHTPNRELLIEAHKPSNLHKNQCSWLSAHTRTHARTLFTLFTLHSI